MGRCDVCGNDYARSFDVHRGADRFTFDSFECAIHRMAPRCEHCGCAIVGHGVQVGEQTYCCAHCARHKRGAIDPDDMALPHDRDEKIDSSDRDVKAPMDQAYRDLASGQVDTDLRGTPGIDASRRDELLKR